MFRILLSVMSDQHAKNLKISSWFNQTPTCFYCAPNYHRLMVIRISHHLCPRFCLHRERARHSSWYLHYMSWHSEYQRSLRHPFGEESIWKAHMEYIYLLYAVHPDNQHSNLSKGIPDFEGLGRWVCPWKSPFWWAPSSNQHTGAQCARVFNRKSRAFSMFYVCFSKQVRVSFGSVCLGLYFRIKSLLKQ